MEVKRAEAELEGIVAGFEEEFREAGDHEGGNWKLLELEEGASEVLKGPEINGKSYEEIVGGRVL